MNNWQRYVTPSFRRTSPTHALRSYFVGIANTPLHPRSIRVLPLPHSQKKAILTLGQRLPHQASTSIPQGGIGRPPATRTMSTATAIDLAKDFVDFVNASPSPFHAVDTSKKRLLAAGFTEIKETDSWSSLKTKSKYFFTRNGSSIVAFAIGGKYVPGEGAFSVVGAHTDSPCPKLKPNSKKEKIGYEQVGVQLYGGGLWHTWFDRDLGVAGRIVTKNSKGALEEHLVNIPDPIMRIPSLAIHLDRSTNDAFKFNNETNMTPILAMAISKAANEKPTVAENEVSASSRIAPGLLELVASISKVSPSDILDFELAVYDVQKSTIGGLKSEFVYSARLDNLMMSYCALTALTNSSQSAIDADSNIRAIVLFDNEEIGSTSAYGAASNLLEITLRRLSQVGAKVENVDFNYEKVVAKSLLVSADMAHAVHPNYVEKHEDQHRPYMNKGVVIKHNANQRYATTAVTSAILRTVAEKVTTTLKCECPLQDFVVRNDSPCGSTIGPMLSAQLGIRTIDVGNPQLAMHSVRECAGVEDILHAVRLFGGFFDHFAAIQQQSSL